jgi:hypothetical protein
MNRPETQDEFERYCASERGRYYINSKEFSERCAMLDARLANDAISVTDAADLIGLPVDVFRHMVARYLAVCLAFSLAGSETVH